MRAPCSTQASLLAALAAASTLAVAQAPAPSTNPASSGPSFRESEDIPDLKGYNDAYAFDEIKIGGKPLTEDQQVVRWQDELKAGRARAGAMLGAYSSYLALTAADCAVARDALLKADELGSDQAAWLLAQLAANPSCGDVDRAALERWLKKSVTLDYAGAAHRPHRASTPKATKPDPVQQYIYARVAAGYWEDGNKLTQPRRASMPRRWPEMEKNLSAADRSRADAEAAKILAAMLKRHDRFGSVAPVEFARADAGGKAGVRRLHRRLPPRVPVESREQLPRRPAPGLCRDHQQECRVRVLQGRAACARLRDRHRGGGALSRNVLIGPQGTRKLMLGDVNEQPDKKALAVTCTPVPKLAANAAAGKCRAKLQGSIDVERFYPRVGQGRGTEGSTVVRYWVPPGREVATDAEIVTSSGDFALDDAAMATIRSGKFKSDCDYGLSSIRIAFKLQ